MSVLGEGQGGPGGAGQESQAVLGSAVFGVGNGEQAAGVECRSDGLGGRGGDCGLAEDRALQDASMPVAQGRAVGIPDAGRPAGRKTMASWLACASLWSSSTWLARQASPLSDRSHRGDHSRQAEQLRTSPEPAHPTGQQQSAARST